MVNVFDIPNILKRYRPKEPPKKAMQQRPLFRMDNGIPHRDSLNKYNTFDILVTMNDNLTKYHDNNKYCILSLLGSKPKCTFNDDETCDCFNCIRCWMNTIEER